MVKPREKEGPWRPDWNPVSGNLHQLKCSRHFQNELISEHNHRCPECTRGARGFVGHVRRADLRLGL